MDLPAVCPICVKSIECVHFLDYDNIDFTPTDCDKIRSVESENDKKDCPSSVTITATSITDASVFQSENKVKFKADTPPYYLGDGNITCMDAMKSCMTSCNLRPVQAFWYCNAFKYLWRCKDKGGVEDLRKCRNYIDMLIDYLTGDEYDNKRRDTESAGK